MHEIVGPCDLPVAMGDGLIAWERAQPVAIGDDMFSRSPVTLDNILMALEHGRPMQEPLTAHV